MRMEIPSAFSGAVWDAASADAMARWPQEACGFVIGGEYVPMPNSAEQPEEDFTISPADHFAALQRGAIQGVIHSHPQGQTTPSQRDMATQIEMDVPWGVLVMSNGLVRSYFDWGDHLLSVPLEGRPWRVGVFDCFSIVRSSIFQTTGQIVPDIARSDNWWEWDTLALYEGLFPNYPQVSVVTDWFTGNLVKGDIVMLTILGANPNHFCIYQGDGIVVHHMADCLSATRPFVSLQGRVSRVLRFNHA